MSAPRSLLVVGAGGHGKVVADAARVSGRWDRIGFVDDRIDSLREAVGVTVVGNLSALPTLCGPWSHAVVAVGAADRRLQLLRELRDIGYAIASVVHPAAYVSEWVGVGTGSVVLARGVVNPDARLGEGCIVNTGAIVEHDCELADGVHVCPAAALAGNVTVGARSWIGIGAVVRQGIRIGSAVTVGAGSVVVADVPDGATVFGVPARQRTP